MSETPELEGSDKDSYRQQEEAHSDDASQLTLWQEQAVVIVGERAGLTWEEATNGFLRTLDSPNTERAYRRHLRNAGQVMEIEFTDEVTGARLAEYRAFVTGSSLAPNSQAQGLSAIRAFLLWGGALGIHNITPQVIGIALKTPRGGVQTRYAILSEPEIVGLFEAAASARDRAIVGVLVGCGVRVAEAAGIHLADLTEDSEGHLMLFVARAKGRRPRHVPVGDDVAKLLREYIGDSRRFLGAAGPLFLANDRGAPSRETEGLSVRGIARVVETLAVRARVTVKRVSPHALRHTFAVRALRTGGNVLAVSKLLGHSSIATTQRYVDHLALSELRSAVPTLPVDASDANEAAS